MSNVVKFPMQKRLEQIDSEYDSYKRFQFEISVNKKTGKVDEVYYSTDSLLSILPLILRDAAGFLEECMLAEDIDMED